MKEAQDYFMQRISRTIAVDEAQTWTRAMNELFEDHNPDEAIKRLKGELWRNNEVLQRFICDDDGKRKIRELCRKRAEGAGNALDSIATKYGNGRVWGVDWPDRATDQEIRVARYVGERMEAATKVPSNTPPDLAIQNWRRAFQAFQNGDVQPMIDIMSQERAKYPEILNILLARKLPPA